MYDAIERKNYLVRSASGTNDHGGKGHRLRIMDEITLRSCDDGVSELGEGRRWQYMLGAACS